MGRYFEYLGGEKTSFGIFRWFYLVGWKDPFSENGERCKGTGKEKMVLVLN